MIEAYEIGIRLALDDGISAGVQAIRRELVELDRVVEASSVRLASLRAAAGFVAIPSVAEPPRREAGPSAEPEEAQAPARAVVPGPEPGEEQPPDAARRAPSSGPEFAAEKLDDGAPAASAPSSSGERRVAPAEPVADAAPYRTGPASPSDAKATTGVTALDDAGAPTEAAPVARPAMGPAAPSVVYGRPAAAPPIAAELSRERATPAAAEPPPRHAATPAVVTVSEPMAMAPLPAADPLRPTRAGTSEEAPPSRSAAAPTATLLASPPLRRPSRASHPSASGAARETVAPERGASDPKPAAAQAGEGADQRTMEVYIYLEGAPLGRWMADQLDRAASRPAASLTGFDPRVSPAWPGAPIA